MKNEQTDPVEIFMPGRLCLFGEHSDWAGGYRIQYSDVEPGYCLITGTNQGIYARAIRADGVFRINSRISAGKAIESFQTGMNPDDLASAARSQIFASYSAGTAYETLKRYPAGGVSIDAYRMDLPLKKGLSSSAAICMLTVRALNLIYGLKLNKTEEMDIAYRGEIITGSECGRMDQACAFGSQPTFLTFDGIKFEVEPLSPVRDIYLSIVDLKGEKDTRTILKDLNAAFCNRFSAQGANVRKALGSLNAGRLRIARQMIIQGDAVAIGRLMSESQRDFDEWVAPASPHQLESPRLHQLLSDRKLKDLSLGCKGVGSQGDGCAQLIFPDPDQRATAEKYLESKYRMTCFPLTIPAFMVK